MVLVSIYAAKLWLLFVVVVVVVVVVSDFFFSFFLGGVWSFPVFGVSKGTLAQARSFCV